ncbi:hypothetical protein CDV36_016064 [Fusarium kuroshium]|uniref:FAD dependent oxidoreductase domain-containing protein n=1 Tax=Fusarium kuroshium TaxID=2010991 RepID=A0A3M2R1H0_9HYPO|nr:hypothetical protein CDV36_016064 [Fusarium kuroshium]
MSGTLSHSTPIIVVGAGVFGLSTAWWLARAGYSNFWREPLWKDVFHPTGWLYGTDDSLDEDRAKTFDTAVSNTRTLGDPSQIAELPDWEHMFKLYPAMGHHHDRRKRQQGRYESTQANAPATFRGIWNSNAGWVESTNAMFVLKRECERLGVVFIAGESGTVTGFVRDPNDTKTVIGVRTANRTIWQAKKVIVSVGTYSETLLDFKNQLHAVGYPATHIRMTEEQYQRYKDLPVVAITRRGYFFPPNEDRIFKIYNMDVTMINRERWAEPECD